MIVTYNNTEYSFDDEISIWELTKSPIPLPLNEWEPIYVKLFRGFPLWAKLAILKNRLESADYESKGFIYNDKNYWFSKDDRTSISNLIDAFDDTFTFILGEQAVDVPIDKAKLFLQDLNVYAYKCLIAYTKYLQRINSEELVETFEFPEKLNLNDYIAS